ncbi:MULTISPECIES: hypothetical protein [unclassified Bradyrhizobium]|uniref:hypothetical protein n=1 Tax=unclassified Bradyrhizobium TaxID=2631580 RepID=UPI002FF042AF
MRRLWALLSDPIVNARRYGSVERAKTPFAAKAFDAARQEYEDERRLFVRGEKNGFVASFSRRREGWSNWDIWMNIRELQGSKMQPWLDWFFRLCNEFSVLYGFGCSVSEHDAKHLRVRRTPTGGAATGAVGAASQEFLRYLPGLYWLTILGPELTKAFGAEKINSLPGVRVFQLKSQQIAICLDEPVVPKDMDGRLQKERKLADILGAQYFFDRNRADLKFGQVPELLQTLEKLGR